MKPLKFGKATASFLSDRLLLFNTSAMVRHYLGNLLAKDSTRATSKGGIPLPPELWDRILADCDDNFVFVKSSIVSETPTRKVIRCQLVEFDMQHGFGVFAENDSVVYLCELFFNSMSKAVEKKSISEIAMPRLREVSGPGSLHDVVLEKDRHAEGQEADKPSCLFWDIDIPDVIARMENGWCGFCGTGRFICPGCTGGRADRFDVFMGCGVLLACPLCMGVDFAQDHKDFLRYYYSETAPEDEQREMDRAVQERLKELGYCVPWP